MYILSKASKFGIKIIKLTSNSGYVITSVVYYEKDDKNPKKKENFSVKKTLFEFILPKQQNSY